MMDRYALGVFVSGCEVLAETLEVACTFHISFSFVDDECIAVGFSFSISDDSYPFYGSVHLELAS